MNSTTADTSRVTIMDNTAAATTTVPTTDATTTATTTTEPPVTTTTTNPPTTTTTTMDPTTTTTTIVTTTDSPLPTTTNPTTIGSSTTATNEALSTTVGIVTVTSTSGGVTYTTAISTSIAAVPTASTSVTSNNSSHSTNVGAIVGGVVGGIALIAIIAGLIFFTRRRRNRNDTENPNFVDDDVVGGPAMAASPFTHDYHTYGSHTASDNNSVPSRPTSMNAPGMVGGMKPRPFVQAYDPMLDEQNTQYAYNAPYNDYTTYSHGNSSGVYTNDNFYQQEPMMPNNNMDYNGRNVPDENDYYIDPMRKPSRHVPNEKSN